MGLGEEFPSEGLSYVSNSLGPNKGGIEAEEEVQEPREHKESKKEGTDEGVWEESCLKNFNNFLGFPTKSFEEDILNLMTKISEMRKEIKAKGNQGSSTM